MFVWSLHLAGAAVVALTVGGFYSLVYQPLERQQSEAVDRTAQFDLLLVQTGTEGREYRRLRDQAVAIKASVAELRGLLVAPQEEAAYVANLRRIADEVDLEILDTQIGLTKTMATHSQTEVALRCHGSYASICQFLLQAEQFTKIAKLSRLELEAIKNSRGYPIQLTFVLYSEGESHDTKETRGVL